MKILILCITVLIVGCSTPTISKFDPVQYNHFVELSYAVQQAKAECINPNKSQENAETLFNKSQLIKLYVDHKNVEPQVKDVTQIVSKNISQFRQAYQNKFPSTGYCTEKLTIINDGLDKILIVLGNKPQ